MLQDDLKRFFRGDVAVDEATLAGHSVDASLFKVRPQAVVFPKDVKDIENLVEFVNVRHDEGEQFSITPRAAGTDMSGGPLGESIILDVTRYINAIRKFGDDYAVVEPGLYYRDFEVETLRRNLILPSYPASKHLCAMGGIVANNSGGEKTLAYGKTEDYVEEVSVVLADGKEYSFGPLTKLELESKMKQKNFGAEVHRKIYRLIEENYDSIQKAKPRVSKNSAGYALWNVWDRKVFNLAKLFVGSQGTLGIITSAMLKLVHPKKYSRLGVIFLNDLAPLSKIVERVLALKPQSFESYDDKTLHLAIKFLPQMLQLMKAKGLFSLAMQFLPELWMTIKNGRLPKLILLIEFADDDQAMVAKRLSEMQESLQEFNLNLRVTKNEGESEKYWAIRRESFNLLRQRVEGKQTAPFIDDIIVTPDKLPEFLPKLNAILDKYSKYMIYTIAGHVGDGNFHIIPLMDLSDAKAREIIPILADEVYALVFQYKGSITAEHNDGLIRSPYLAKMYGDKIYSLFTEIKDVFDPRGIFNPHKKIGATIEYAISHMKHGA